jgi:hypothetical protein
VTRSIVIAAALAQRPGVGGHTWFALQYLLGFRALGWEVLLVDRLDDPRPGDVEALARELDRFGLGDAWSVLLPGGRTAGRSRAEVERRLCECDLLLDVMGYLDDPELRDLAPARVFLDIDPGFGQMWRALGLADVLAGHDRFVSVGLNVGRATCSVPDCGVRWTTTLPPVALDHWPAAPGGKTFTTIASWRGPFGPVEYEGRTYGLRVHQFRRFMELPRRTGADFELALAIDPAETPDLDRLRENGWRLADPARVAGDTVAYRRHIRRSGAELTVAKGMYVDTRSGWFSDRSACYLAAGKPVVAQDTGFAEHLPCGEGLLAFSTPDEAADAVARVTRDRARHARAARALAEEHLDARRVLPRLIDELEVV